jgi:hypothetical protein
MAKSVVHLVNLRCFSLLEGVCSPQLQLSGSMSAGTSERAMTPRKITAALFAIATAGLATEAQADSASFTITVTIPPFSEALAARDSGAAGDWTILSSGGGFLVNLPDVAAGSAASGEAAPSSTSPLSIYRSDRNRFTLNMSGDNGDTPMSPSAVTPGENLVQIDYLLPQAGPAAVSSGQLRVVFAGL